MQKWPWEWPLRPAVLLNKHIGINSPINELDIRKVCENALEKNIYSDFFPVHQKEKIRQMFYSYAKASSGIFKA